LNYNHLYQQPPDNYVDFIGPNGGTILFKSQDNRNRAVNYDGPSDNYRSIHSAFIFGALRDGSDTKTQLMDIYIDYLISGPVAVGESNQKCVVDNLSISPNPCIKSTNIKFALPRSTQVKIRVYNIAGQLVRHIINDNLEKGTHNFTWKGNDDSGKTLSSGTYIIKIETDRETINRAIVLVK
jgi:hypothetical protein